MLERYFIKIVIKLKNKMWKKDKCIINTERLNGVPFFDRQ